MIRARTTLYVRALAELLLGWAALLLGLAACGALAFVLTPSVNATPSPGWTITLAPLPANYAPGGEGEMMILATNVGAAPTAGAPTELQASLPEGLVPKDFNASNSTPGAEVPECDIDEVARTLSCETSKPVGPGRYLLITMKIAAGMAEGDYEAQALIRGGGAGSGEAKAKTTIAVQPGPVSFGLLPGFAAPTSEEDGLGSVLAGSHPFQMTTELAFPTRNLGSGLTNDGHPKQFSVELPRGLVGDPAASPVLCTELQLAGGGGGCPPASQVGVTDVTTVVASAGTYGVSSTPLYDMVPPPGAAAEIATNVAAFGIYAHVLATVKSGSDYHVSAQLRDVLAFGQEPIFNAQAQIWGDPTGKAHDTIRDKCIGEGNECPAKEVSEAPFLRMPGDCPGDPLTFEALTHSWEDPATELSKSYESADLQGNPVRMEGCGQLQFEPQIEARPTTDKADSPAGLDFELKQPQEQPREDPLAGRATAILKDATISFPAGLTVNPAQAAGLGACSEDQVGYEGREGEALRFTEAAQSCPDAAKLGTVEARSPLLVQRDADHKLLPDPETGAPQARPLEGSLYLAAPFQNPFGSLIAVYLVVEDPTSGIVAKLAGEGSLDPTSGQITTRFRESPEVPIEDVAVHIFGGDRGAFTTPGGCGEYSTAADLAPWSYRPSQGEDPGEGEEAHPTDSFAVSSAPDGGPCPAVQPNSPSLRAGTLQPLAGKYSPLTFRLSREDGSERFSRVEATLPPGLTAKLAGVGQCSEPQISAAKAREAPNMGAAEIADPSCPADSELGTVDVAAGSGPHPFHITGHAYLAGPYEGAPLSLAIITPAVAGPFDLGTVVVRAAVYLDPATARARAVSDPLPQLIDGVPADVRSVSLDLDRPSFVLNPTSCDEESFSGQATSALGHVAPLFERFQVGGCRSLPYKPKLFARLFGKTHRGAHPRLRAVFLAKPGEANTARVSFALPHSEFIDQAHFRTICTRVQFAAHSCPSGSVYGHMKAITPLLGYPLQGPVYLRSSSHELPDVVADLRGPPSQPIELELDGRVDSVHGGVRTIFQSVPDAPVAKAIITMQGKRKGLFQNSTDICRVPHRATLQLEGQNGKVHDSRPLLRASCPTHNKRHRRHR